MICLNCIAFYRRFLSETKLIAALVIMLLMSACRQHQNLTAKTIIWSDPVEHLLKDTLIADKNTDSLRKEVLKASIDTGAINRLLNLASNWNEKEELLLKECLQQSKSSNYNAIEAHTLGMLGNYYAGKLNNAAADSFYRIELDNANISKDVEERIRAYENLVGLSNISEQRAAAAIDSLQKLARNTKNQKTLFDINNTIGDFYSRRHRNPLALKFYLNAFNYLDTNNVKQSDNVSLNLKIGSLYSRIEDNQNALFYFDKAGRFATLSHDTDNLAAIYQEQTSIYLSLDDTTRSDSISTLLLHLCTKESYKENANWSFALSNYYRNRGKSKEAIFWLNQSLMKGGNISAPQRYIFTTIMLFYEGACYIKLDIKDSAKLYLLKAMDTLMRGKNQLNSSDTMIYVVMSNRINLALSVLMLQYHDKPAARKFIKQSIPLDRFSVSDIIKDYDYYKDLSDIYDTLDMPRQALTAYRRYVVQRDSLLQRKQGREMSELQSQVRETQMKADSDARLARSRLVRNSFFAGLILAFLLAVPASLTYRRVKRDNQIITEQSQIANTQRMLAEQKNKDLMESIAYAERLQQAILPSISQIRHYLPQSFLFFKPKDIVSGDFYWFEVVNEVVYFAVCDCTGHGVPGAMVSVICSDALNRTLREFGATEPSKILDNCRKLVAENFKSGNGETADGMDASLCAYRPGNSTLEWAGANLPLWLLRDGELKEIKGDKQPVGRWHRENKFTNYSIELKPGDQVYLFTDGYADQFGGEKGRKMGRMKFRELLLNIQKSDIDTQAEQLEKYLADYMGITGQVDDILVMGIKF